MREVMLALFASNAFLLNTHQLRFATQITVPERIFKTSELDSDIFQL